MGTTLKQPLLRIPRPFDRWQWLGAVFLTIGTGCLLVWIAELLGLSSREPDLLGGTPLLFLSGVFLLTRNPDDASGSLGLRRWWPLFGLAGLVFLILDLVR